MSCPCEDLKKETNVVSGCYTDSGGGQHAVLIHLEYLHCSSDPGKPGQLHAAYYTYADDPSFSHITLQSGETVQAGLCGSTAKEYDHHVRCHNKDGRPIIVVVSYDTTGIPTSQYFEIDGTPFTDLTELGSCGQRLETHEIVFCGDGKPVIQWFITDNGQVTGVGYWTDIFGAFISPPSVIVPGACAQAKSFLTHGEELNAGQSWSIPTFLAANPAASLRSVAMRQVSGYGKVSSDTGSIIGTTITQCMSWSVDDDENNNNLNSSVLEISCGSGVIHITAVYTT
jgi:hypothetical protein